MHTEENTATKSNRDELRKKLLIFGGIGLGILIVLLLIVWIFSMIMGQRLSYDKIEDKMRTAAQKYYEKNKQLLPSHGGEVSVDVTTLSSAKFMKSLDKLAPKGVSCTGKVVVKENDGIYSYVPYLDCGEKYTSVELYKKVIDEKNIVTTSNGLYQMNNEYVFRGEEVNNYVQTGEYMWRIVKVTPDNEIQLILSNSKFKSPWDNRYNIERQNNVGINDYSVSRIRSYLDDLYQENELFSDSLKSKMVAFDLCTTKRTEEVAINDGSIECATTLQDQKVGLLPLYSYINASLDVTCKQSLDAQCQNYNYLGLEEYNWWTLTGDGGNTYRVYSINVSGNTFTSYASNNIYVRPVIQLSNDVMYQSGSGTEEDPYIIQ